MAMYAVSLLKKLAMFNYLDRDAERDAEKRERERERTRKVGRDTGRGSIDVSTLQRQ